MSDVPMIAQKAPFPVEVEATMRELGFDIVTAASRGILGPPNMPPEGAAAAACSAATADPRHTALHRRPGHPRDGLDLQPIAEKINAA